MSDSAADRLASEVATAARRPGARRTLLLDLDGTIAPVAAKPESARVPSRTLAALDRLRAAGWSIAIVSGRPAAEVRVKVPLPGVRIFGGHGLEGLRPPVHLRRGLRRRMAGIAERAERLARLTPGACVEVKPSGLAFHDRAVSPGALARWRRRLRDLLDSCDLEGLEVLPGRRVVELRPRGVHKGLVLRAVPSPPPRSARARDASLVALGDDRTDEDLFRELRGRGLAVRVGRGSATTAATRRLASPAAVRRFLERLARGATGRGPARSRR